MRARSRVVLTGAVVFALAMSALESGGWWWVWLAGVVLVVACRGARVPLIGVKLDPASAYILRQNRRTRRHNRQLARHRRRQQRQQRRARRRAQ